VDDLAQLTESQLSALDASEAAIGTDTTSSVTPAAPATCERVSPHMVAHAERDLLVVTELRSPTTVPHRS
jgi:hypothetical protein